jgi:hypothetical protein
VGSVYNATIDQTQGLSFETTIAGTVQHAFTTVDCTSVTGMCRVKTNIIRDFWNVNESQLMFSGVALLDFGRRRNLIAAPFQLRRRRETYGRDGSKEETMSTFTLPFEISHESSSPESSAMPTTSAAQAGCPRYYYATWMTAAAVFTNMVGYAAFL